MMQDETCALNRDFPAPDFCVELTPYRSLGKPGFIVLMTFITLACFLSSMVFWALGAWPVMIFLGLDVLIIWGAFHLNYRSARMRERISIWREKLLVQKYNPNGHVVEHSFNPFWTRFVVDRHDEIGITAMRLASRKRIIEIGAFLNPDDRESFALAFASALGRSKRA